MTRLTLAILGAWLTLSHCAGPARADVAVTPELVCTVQNSYRARVPWEPHICGFIADTLNAESEPVTLLALAVLESDMRPHVATWHGPHRVDAGLLGVRCHVAYGVCSNWPVRGVAVEDLRTALVNIRAGAQVLEKKRQDCGARALDCYAGDATGKSGRTGDVAAIVAAFGGVEVQVKSKRVRELVRRIAAAVRRQHDEKRS